MATDESTLRNTLAECDSLLAFIQFAVAKRTGHCGMNDDEMYGCHLALQRVRDLINGISAAPQQEGEPS